MKLRAVTTLLALAAATLAGSPSVTADNAAPLKVVELFTSQACSACPPADDLLGRLAREEGVLALSYSVDYWDYLDWQDTLADPAFTARQKAYAKSRGDRAVYTPQAIINGVTHAIGSKGQSVREKLSRTAAKHGVDSVAVDLETDGDHLVVSAGMATAEDPVSEATLWLVVFSDSETVTIGAGENKGRTITYYNAVRRLEAIGSWHGEPVKLLVAMPDIEGGGCAVLLQEGGPDRPGRILAAGRL